MFDYEKLGLKVGLEIHQQLDTEKKLFCGCSCNLWDQKPDFKILRRLRPTQSELGEIDRAAFEEARRKLKFIYEAYNHKTCLVEADEEPPNPLNMEAIELSLIIACLLNMHVVDEFYTMRKQVIDGSNTGGFQRTGLVATDGFIDTDYGRVIIENLCLEEDAARRIGHKKGAVIFRLDRLGIPLVEITTSPSMKNPQQVKEVAYQIGQILRSTKVRRGIGAIRQDLNISIKGGARVEIKGVQDLDLMPKIVENEVKRQVELQKIRDELQRRNATVEGKLYDVGEIFEDTKSKIISKSKAVLAAKLNGFSGLIGREIQPNRRFGTELADYAKKMGVSGIFHTDELPGYGISEEEVKALREFVGASDDDAVVLVADDKKKAKDGLFEVQRRAKIAISEIPEETRKALPDGNTQYLRPLPTASRMYVETDIPPILISKKLLEKIRSNLPELPEEKKARLMEEYNLSEDLAIQLVRKDKVTDLKKIIEECDVDPTIVASTLVYTLKELKRDGHAVWKLDTHVLKSTFDLLADDKITKEAIPQILIGVCDYGCSPEEAAVKFDLIMLSKEEIEKIVDEVISTNAKLIKERGEGAIGPLMGIAMKKLKGKADGKLVNMLLRNKLHAKL